MITIVTGKLPSIMTIGAAAFTSIGIWVGAIGHQRSYKMNRFRYTGGLGYMNINISFYGVGIIQEERAYNFKNRGIVFFRSFL